ncbi:MAG: LemA family protein [Candidatus Kapaibacterium sp.]|jgi:LemA protein
MKKAWIIVILVILIAVIWGAGSYNNFVTADADVKLQLGNVNTAYQQRADLIPNLVETVKGAAGAERQTLTDVIAARASATQVKLTPETLKDPAAFQNFESAQNSLGGALSRLLVVTEKYPDLRSQGNFPVLMSQLEGQESRIRVERNKYNQAVRDYNVRVARFPGNLLAGIFGFTKYPEFEAAQGAENAPKVNFGTTPSSTTAPADGSTQAPAATAPKPSDQPHGAVRPAPVK